MAADFVERVVQRLRQDAAFSRNRHFLALSSPEGRRALRIHRHLRSIERDLARGFRVRVDEVDRRVRLTLEAKGARRVAWLSGSEFRLLCESPAVRAALGAGPGPV
ncbi:hypothetical protein [Anaeromyxobacter paludicola]|uniref:Uncharacterized protein n=1 Tax=Anaeromyxobacter paludicola TaxID=2918171 RepID=A0ABM7XB58_9BACT|nr:hypothetical protein [Anaeromyxobacter paludicola]BDG09082.1 hypothetical protein AMPC_21950 [Anaeromyxobacter paludicola]